jgi:3-methylfumaryl-CoA hydratase
MATDIAALRQWIGKSETRSDVVTPTPIAALAATLDRTEPWPQPGDPLPPIWHWLYFLPIYPLAASGADGHPTRGEFLPPVALPRRMWAGSRLVFHRPLRVGAAIQRTSRIADVTAKEGRAGPLVFVRVRHEIADGKGVAIVDEHDIVYRGNPRPGDVAAPPPPAPGNHAFAREIDPGPVLLFRYSALTFNSHRIHYDRSYVTSVEGYPGLVVHGPLIATLLLDLLRRERPDATVVNFEFRAVSPLFDGERFAVCGSPADDRRSIRLWAKNARGGLAMDGTATLAPEGLR